MSLDPVPEPVRVLRDEVVLAAFQALQQGFAPRARAVVITVPSPTRLALTIQPRLRDGMAAEPELEYGLELALLQEGRLLKEVRTPAQPTPVRSHLDVAGAAHPLTPQAIMQDVLAEWRRGFA